MKIARLPPLADSVRGIRDTSSQDVSVDPAPRLRKRKQLLAAWITVAAVLTVGIVFLARSWLSTAMVVPRERVRIATVERGKFIRDVAAQGMIVAADSPTLYASAGGKLTLLVKAGETVKRDQVLASIDSPELRNESQREQATLDALNATLERQGIEVRRQQLKNRQDSDLAAVQIQAAERELQRAETAWQFKGIPEYQYRAAIDNVATARLKHQHALDNTKLENDSLNIELKSKRLDRDRQGLLVENLKRRLDELRVRSPVNGMVGSLVAAQNAVVGENAPLLSVVDLSALEIEFRVPESYADSLGIGMTAEVAYMDKVYAGTVAAISPEVQQNEVAGRVRFSKETPPGIRQNQRVNVRIIMDSRDAVLKVERGNFTDAGSWAYVVDKDMATRRAIQLGAMSIKEVEIVSGLNPGEQIIVNNPTEINDAPTVRLSN